MAGLLQANVCSKKEGGCARPDAGGRLLQTRYISGSLCVSTLRLMGRLLCECCRSLSPLPHIQGCGCPCKWALRFLDGWPAGANCLVPISLCCPRHPSLGVTISRGDRDVWTSPICVIREEEEVAYYVSCVRSFKGPLYAVDSPIKFGVESSQEPLAPKQPVFQRPVANPKHQEA
jgi:hypothetical protein